MTQQVKALIARLMRDLHPQSHKVGRDAYKLPSDLYPQRGMHAQTCMYMCT